MHSLAGGLIALHRSLGDARLLELAAQITDKQIRIVLGRSGRRILLHFERSSGVDRPIEGSGGQRGSFRDFGDGREHAVSL